MTLAYKCMDIVEIGVKAYPIAIDTFFRHHMFCVRSPYQLKRDPITNSKRVNPNRSSCSLRERTEKSHKMSQYIVPNWNLKHQRQEQVEEEEGNRSSHVHNQQQNHPSSTSPLVPNMYAPPFLCYYIFFL